MIEKFDSSKTYEVINLGRPSLLTSSDFERWCKIHEWIKTSNMEIVVCSFFYDVEIFLMNAHPYSGAGFNYNFWLKHEDAKEFQKKIQEIARDF
ncbi:MAG: hypothetical protein QXN55_00755 [Candidatus Nitrosotenuis sp.]